MLHFHSAVRRAKKYSALLLLLALLLMAAVFRVAFLSQIPLGINWDEAAYGYNALSLAETGMDEWGISYPFFLKSFGDYKPALLSYLLIPVFSIFGPGNAAVRIVPALLSTIGIGACYFIVLKLSKSNLIAFLTAFVLALSPWHLHFSRLALDPTIAHAFLLFGVAFWLGRNIWHKIVGVVFLLLSMYAYNAERLFVPLLMAAHVLILWFGQYRKQIAKYWLPLVLFFVGSCVFAYLMLFSEIGTRAQGVSFFSKNYMKRENPDRDLIVLFSAVADKYTQYFSAEFLFLPEGNTHAGAIFGYTQRGNLLEVLAPFFVIGLCVVAVKRTKANVFFFVWMLLAPIAGSLTTDGPHAGRALIMLPAVNYIIVLGLVQVAQLCRKIIPPRVVFALFILLIAFSFSTYWKDYVMQYPKESEYLYSGYVEEPLQWIEARRSSFEHVFITSKADFQILQFYAWYNRIDPQIIQKAERSGGPFPYFLRSYENLEMVDFGRNEALCSLLTPNSLVLLTESEAAQITAPPSHTFYYFQPQADLPKTVSFKAYDTTALPQADFSYLQRTCVADSGF